jgi:hypothetical protein
LSKNCVSPPELEDGQLLAYLDDREAHPATALHLKMCPYCRERAGALDRVQKRLRSRLYRLNCPDPMELGEYHLRMLPASQMLVVAQHVRECPHCAREVSELDGFLSDLAPAPGEGLLGQARVLFARLVGRGQPGGTALTAAPAALRGAGEGPVTLEADGIVITLELQPGSNGQVSIFGQVAAGEQDEWTGALVELRPAGAPFLTALLDDLGAFEFEGLAPDSIELTITSPHGIAVHSPRIDIAL